MGGGRRTRRPGYIVFLTLFLLVISGEIAFLAADGAPLQIRVETYPANPRINRPWSIFVFINHPNAEEVNVVPPRFPPSMVLERVIRDTRPVDGDGLWTRVEFQLTPLEAGLVNLAPFAVNILGRRSMIPGMSIRFLGETVVRYEPRFRWQTPIPSVHVGERGELILELTNWNPTVRAPAGFFQGKVPPNAILGENLLPPSGAVIRYRISIIPLENSNISLQAISFNSEGYQLSIPGITVPVLPKRTQAAPIEAGGAPALQNELTNDGASEDYSRFIPFPQSRELVFALVQREYDQIRSNVRGFWDDGFWAEALAEIRKNERDSLAGPFLVPLRKDMERALGLLYTENERWRPFGISLFFYAFLLMAITSVFVFLFVFRHGKELKIKNISFSRKNGFLFVVVMVIAVGLLLMLLEESLGNYLMGRSAGSGNTAVLRSTQAFRVPDLQGAVIEWFDEGQPVTVGGYSGNWSFAETPDGRAGWVPREALIVY